MENAKVVSIRNKPEFTELQCTEVRGPFSKMEVVTMCERRGGRMILRIRFFQTDSDNIDILIREIQYESATHTLVLE